jgi:long-subunit fatty acid transport protein
MKGLWIKTGLLVIAFTGVAFGQITMDFLGGGARAQGMGKAFYSVSDDISAVTWNPAGLAKQEKPILGVSYGLFDPRGSFNTLLTSGPSSGVNYKQSGSFNNISFLGFLAPLRLRGHQFVLSAAYNRAFDEYSAENYESSGMLAMKYQGLIYGYVPATSVTAFDYHAAPYTMTFGFGTRLYHSWDFGLALNIYTGKGVSQLNQTFHAPEYLPVDHLGQSVQYDSLVNIVDTVHYGGASLTFATRYTSPKYDLGLVIKTGYSLREKSNAVIVNEAYYNGLLLANVKDTSYEDDQLTKVKVPMVIGAGATYKIKPNWIGSIDLEYRPWSGKEVKRRTKVIIKSGDNIETYKDTLPGWYNAFVVRLGTEYVWETKNTILPRVPLRAGIGYVPVPAPSFVSITPNTTTVDDTTDYIVNTESMTMYTLSCGTGVYWQQIHLDLAYTYSTLNRKYYTVAEQKGRNHSFTLSFTGYF